jgi:ABC-2 type transport system ATP-binding protein
VSELPAALAPRLAGRDGIRFVLDLPDYGELESILASLRQAGVGVRDMALSQADLEEVFLKIMHGGMHEARDAS